MSHSSRKPYVFCATFCLVSGPFGCNELREQMVHLNLEFSGGSEIVVGKKKFHQIDLPSDPSITIRDLIQWMMSSLIEKDKFALLK